MIIAKYNLFQTERASGMTIELLINKLRNNIKVESEKTDNEKTTKTDNEKTTAFRITYRDHNPEVAQKVAAELASRYVNTQRTESTQNAKMTREFVDAQLENARNDLNGLEKQRQQIMMQNVETLPESAQSLIAQLDGLRQREETISKDKESLTTERGRLNDSIRALNSQARLIEDFGEKETKDAVIQASRIEDTPAYAQLIQKRAELSSKLENLKKQYREKHPDIIQLQTDIDIVNEELEKLLKNTNRRIELATQSGTRKAQMQKENLDIERQKAESQIGQIDQQLQMKEEELRQNSAQIAALESKINKIPNVKVALEGINNQYETAKKTYDDIVMKSNESQQQVQRESNAQGETISVIDAANLPRLPANASKKPLIMALGAGIGLALGLFLAAIFEVPRWFKIQSVEDTKYYTGLPVFASVPRLLTEREIFWQKGLHWLKVLAGIILALASIPLLIMALQMSHILETIS